MAKVSLVSIQTGPLSPDKKRNIRYGLSMIDKATKKCDADYILFPELATTQFFCVGLGDKSFFDWAEPVPGPSTEAFAKKAEELGSYIILPLFERGRNSGEFYNSAVVVAPDGKLVEGVLPDGTKLITCRKNAISSFRWGDAVNDEKFYFRSGTGFPVFQTTHAKIGILICYDRWFTEAWRLLSLQGAEIVFVPNASFGYVSDMFTCLLRASAAQNIVYAVASNKVGRESVAGRSVYYYGASCIIGPDGKVLVRTQAKIPRAIACNVDLAEVDRIRKSLFIYRDRKPEAYWPLNRIN